MDKHHPDSTTLIGLMSNALQEIEFLQPSCHDIRSSQEGDEIVLLMGHQFQDIYVEILTEKEAYIRNDLPRLMRFGHVTQEYQLDLLIRLRTDFDRLSKTEAIRASLTVAQAIYETTLVPVYWYDTDVTYADIKQAIRNQKDDYITLIRELTTISYKVDSREYKSKHYLAGFGVGFPLQ